MHKRIFYLFLCSVLAVSCKKSGDALATETTAQKVVDLGKGPSVSWKILDDVPGSKPSKRGFYATYASTGVAAIDSAEENSVNKFFADFKTDKATKPAPEYLQSEDVLVSNSLITAFFVRQYHGSAKDYFSSFIVRYYDSKDGKKLSIPDFFTTPKDFSKFQQLSKNYASVALKKMISEDHDIAEDEKNTRLQQMKQNISTGATAEEFKNTVFDDKFATVIFTPGKIAAEDYGKIFVKIPMDSVKPLLAEKYSRHIISLNSARFLPPIPPASPKKVQPAVADSIPKPYVPENVVALTFDDGPCNYDPKLLQILREKNVKATFFVVGKGARFFKPILKQIHAEGHQIANHSWNHADFRKLSLREVRQQLDDTNAEIFDATGQLPSVFRPPYGAFTPGIRAVSDMPIMLWNIDPLDWKDRNTVRVLAKMSKGGPEDIVLGHDIHITTVNAIPQLIDNLKAKGLKFVTIDELFAGFTLKPGKPYAQKHRPVRKTTPPKTAAVTKAKK